MKPAGTLRHHSSRANVLGFAGLRRSNWVGLQNRRGIWTGHTFYPSEEHKCKERKKSHNAFSAARL